MKYLRLVNLDRRRMPPAQIREIRRAFYGGIGQLIILQRDEIANHTQEEAVAILNGFIDEVGKFWLEQTNRNN